MFAAPTVKSVSVPKKVVRKQFDMRKVHSPPKYGFARNYEIITKSGKKS